MELNRNLPIPLHYQLKQILLEKLHDQTWKPGELIPGEQELQDQYGVSRAVVRQTLGDLVNDGYFIRQRGRGTIVARKKIAFDPSSGIELNGDKHKNGKDELGWKLIDSGLVDSPMLAAEALKLVSGSRVLRTRRLRMAGTQPLGYHIAYLPEKWVNVINKNNFEQGDSLAYLAQLPELHNARTLRTLEARLANPEDAKLIQISKGMPILYLERLVMTEDGMPIEFLTAGFRGDQFKYKITMWEE